MPWVHQSLPMFIRSGNVPGTVIFVIVNPSQLLVRISHACEDENCSLQGMATGVVMIGYMRRFCGRAGAIKPRLSVSLITN